MRMGFVSLFPDMIRDALSHSITGRAQRDGIVECVFANPRDFATDKHRTVDDKPFGGGPGMLMMAPVVDDALCSLVDFHQDVRRAIVLPDPTGNLFNQSSANELAEMSEVVFVCGHYEGIDERFAQHRVTHRFSLGDYVLTGGELPAMIMADAVIRLLPDVLGDSGSLEIDSFSDGLLSSPQYTKPESWNGLAVPDVLRTGNHVAIENWKRGQSLRSTRERRPDLFAKARLAKTDLDMLSS